MSNILCLYFSRTGATEQLMEDIAREVDGELVEYTLAPGQQMVVDTGNVLGFDLGVSIDIQSVPGLKNKLLGGEGLFNTVLTGPGRIWLQTMPLPSVAAAIIPYIPTGNG